MIFSSLVFLCVFLPVVYLLYSVMPSLKLKNGLLILASLLFYAYGEPVYVLLMLFSTGLNYLCARLICLGRGKRAVLVINVIGNLGVLGVFKYTGFFIDSFNHIFHQNLPDPGIALPVGISFFTFQALSYVIDVYQGKVQVQKNFWNVLLYIAFFPQLIAGPIVKYRDISQAIESRRTDIRQASFGMRRFICGLAKKVLIANTMGKVADAVFTADVGCVNVVVAWIGAIAYLFQIYYDFSGYSDMAIGLGKLFGFQFRENFNYPYGAVNIQDFWRKWHISLSGWFKEYLYIPLGGNRKGRARTCINKLIVFFCTGLWHGASWTFVLWGLYHGMFLLLEEYVPVIRKFPKIIGHLYSMLVVCVGFVLFRADTISQAGYMIKEMFTGFHFSAPAGSFAWQQVTPWFLTMLFAAVIGAAPMKGLADKIRSGIYGNEVLSRKWSFVQNGLFILSYVLLLWCMIRLSGSTYNPFIYFRF